jgi:hypothetical protein
MSTGELASLSASIRRLPNRRVSRRPMATRWRSRYPVIPAFPRAHGARAVRARCSVRNFGRARVFPVRSHYKTSSTNARRRHGVSQGALNPTRCTSGCLVVHEIMCPVMSQRACSVFGSLVLATLIAAPAAHAVCKSPKNICKHIDDCLQRTSDNTDAQRISQRIREGVRARNGNMVGAGAEACARDLGKKKEWDDWARRCSDLEYVSIARTEMELGKGYCDRYSQ